MRFVEDDPAQLALRFLEDAAILRTGEHVFEHGDVRHEQVRGRAAQRLAISDLGWGGLLERFARLGSVAIVQRIGNAAVEGLDPRSEPLALRVDQRVQRIKDQPAYAVFRARYRRSSADR